MRRSLLLLLLATLAACHPFALEGPLDPIAVLNRADRSLVVFAVSRDVLPLIDPNPALRAEEFDRQKIEVGQQVTLEQISGYDPGDDLVLMLYARPEELPPQVAERYGSGAAVLIQMKTVTAGDLRDQSNTVVIHDLRP